MMFVSASPGPELRAQLVGLGTSRIPSLPTPAIPPILQAQIQAAGAAGPSTGNGSGSSTVPDLLPPAAAVGPNWLLWGGVGVGVLLLGALLIRR